MLGAQTWRQEGKGRIHSREERQTCNWRAGPLSAVGGGQRRGEIGGVAETKTRSQAISHAKQRTLDLGLLTQNKIEKLKHIKEGGFFPARELGKASWRRCRLRWTGQRKRRMG